MVCGESSASLCSFIMADEHIRQAQQDGRKETVQGMIQHKCWAVQPIIRVSQTLKCCAAILVPADANSATQVKCAFRRLIGLSIWRLWDFSRVHSHLANHTGKKHLVMQIQRDWEGSLLWGSLCWGKSRQSCSRTAPAVTLLELAASLWSCIPVEPQPQFQPWIFHQLQKFECGNF